MVTGGWDYLADGWDSLDTTELLLPSATSWVYSYANLPSPRHRLRGATLNNKIVMTGN